MPAGRGRRIRLRWDGATEQAGVRAAGLLRPTDHLLWSAAGYAQLVVDNRGQGHDIPDRGEGHGTQLVEGFMTRGIDSPQHYYYRRLMNDCVRAVDAVAELPGLDPERALRVATMNSSDKESPDELTGQLVSEGVAGLIIAAPHRWTALALKRVPPQMPTVAIDVERPQRLAPVVGLAQAPGARTATEHLLALGHERVWHLARPADWDSSHLRERGWREAHTDAGRTPPRVMRGDWTARSGYELGRRLAARPEVTAVFAANDQMAIGALRALREAGRDVPGDVSLVGYDDIPEAAYLWPPLTTVRQDFGAAGRRSLDLLVSQMRGAPRDPEVTLIGTELVVRESSAPPPSTG